MTQLFELTQSLDKIPNWTDALLFNYPNRFCSDYGDIRFAFQIIDVSLIFDPKAQHKRERYCFSAAGRVNRQFPRKDRLLTCDAFSGNAVYEFSGQFG
jgi:hypothetical protein